MEISENGASLLPLSVDVNENEENGESYGTLPGYKGDNPTVALRRGPKPCSEDSAPVSALSAADSQKAVQKEAVQENVSIFPPDTAGDMKMLDLLAERPPAGAPLTDGGLNGFTGSSRQQQQLPIWEVSVNEEGRSGFRCQLPIPSLTESETLPDVAADYGKLPQRRDGGRSSVGSCDAAVDMKLANGVLQGDCHTVATGPSEQTVKLPNGGLSYSGTLSSFSLEREEGIAAGDGSLQIKKVSSESETDTEQSSGPGLSSPASTCCQPVHSTGERQPQDEPECADVRLHLRTSASTEDAASSDIRFMDVSLCSRNTFEVSRRQSAPDNLPDGLSLPEEESDQSTKPRKLGITDFFSRNLFSRKIKDLKPPSQSVPGWKLFGKVPLRETTPKDPKTIQQDSNPGNLTSVSTPNLLSTVEYETRSARTTNHHPQSGRRKNLEFEPLSTTALILEDRPANLPAKSAEEALRHRQEYDEMVAEAKKREVKEAQKKKKIMKERYKQEETIANAMVIWNSEILPNWEVMRNTRKVRELWWQGLPPSVRGKVWSLAIGNELNITHELYEIFLSRAKERWRSFGETASENEPEDSLLSGADRESSLELIKLDISRTFPSLFIFQKGGPYHDLLHSVLGAYTCYRPDVGYVQGMSFIAAVLILNLEEADAFIAFANLLNKPCQMAFFRVDHDLMLKYFAAFEVFFEESLPRLFAHFKSYNLTPDIYLIDWIFTLYSKSLPLDLACRVWDVFCRDGEEFLFRTGLGILKSYEDILLQMDFIHIAQFLTKLPEDMTSEKLFSCIAAIQMMSSNKKWAQVFATLMKDNKEGDKNQSPALKS
uniref:TBC1 domain family member 12 n=1 Tax=Erpetoichthys calabaricus TaxID=27687 RepID=A0A8C4RNX2_ERPCA